MIVLLRRSIVVHKFMIIVYTGLEAMMRSMKKSKEKDTESRNQAMVVSKLICTTKGQSSTLNG